MKLRNIKIILLGSIFLTSCTFFPEATFELSDDSKIPLWFKLPGNMSRSDVKIQMNYYVKPSGRTAIFILSNMDNQRLDKVEGTLRGLEPITLQNTPSGYPSYEVITVNGITEIIEHRGMEPIFYINDDPKIFKELGVSR